MMAPIERPPSVAAISNHALERRGVEPGRSIRFEHLALAPVLRHELGSPAARREVFRLLALPDLATDELHEVGLRKVAPAALHLQVLRRGQEPSQHVDARHVARLHRTGEVVRQLRFAETHSPLA